MSRYIQHIINYFFHHKASDELTERVHERLAKVEDDKETDDLLKALWDELDDASLSKNESDEAYSKISSTIFGINRQAHIFRLLRLVAVWVVPLVVLGGAWFIYQKSNRQAEQLSKISFIQKFTSYGQSEFVVLPDSTKVWLNGGSLLVYPSEFISSERSVSLSGEAFFNVTKDSKHPFTVRVNNMTLKVLGTTFNVSSYPDNDETSATLETGRLEVNVDGYEKSYFLRPNDHLVYNRNTHKVDVTNNVKGGDYSVWRYGILYFDDTSFNVAMKQLERAYGVRIHILTTDYDKQTIHAHFDRKESVAKVMSIIKILIPGMKYEIHKQDIYIR